MSKEQFKNAHRSYRKMVKAVGRRQTLGWIAHYSIFTAKIIARVTA